MRSSRLSRAFAACDDDPTSPLATSRSSDRASACLTIVALLDPSRLASSASCAAASSDSRTLNFFIATPHRGSLAHRIRRRFSATSAVAAWRTNRKACARSSLRQRRPGWASCFGPPCRPGSHAELSGFVLNLRANASIKRSKHSGPLISAAACASLDECTVIVSLKRLNKSNVSAVMQRSLSSCCSCWRDNRSSHRAIVAFRRSVPSATDIRRLPLHDGQAREVFCDRQALQPTHVRAIVHLRQIHTVGRIERAMAPHLARDQGLADGATNERDSSGLPFAIRSASSQSHREVTSATTGSRF
jgi:hypothetical protein